jgi:hypothetical protein
MDTSFTFPAPCVPNPPPLLDTILGEILDNCNCSQIVVSNPIGYSNIWDSTAACRTVHAVSRLHKALSSPFNTPDASLSCLNWMKVMFKSFVNIHEGLCNAQLTAPDGETSTAFANLTLAEAALATRSCEVLTGLCDFFWNPHCDDTSSPTGMTEAIVKTHCFQCIQSTELYPLPPKDMVNTIQLTTALDMCQVQETLLNNTVRSIHSKVDTWRDMQHNLLIKCIVFLITADRDEADPVFLAEQVHSLHPELCMWADSHRKKLHAYMCRSLCDKAAEDTLGVSDHDLLNKLILEKQHCVEAEADQAFDHQL